MYDAVGIYQDFEYHPELKAGVKDLLEEMVCNTSLLPAEHKAAASVLRVLTTRDESTTNCVELEQLLMHPMVSSPSLQHGSSLMIAYI